ncbi:DUF1080 domain-containing protein [bacterium]|nr:DUF1080 domain-containing protein [bacterium]
MNASIWIGLVLTAWSAEPTQERFEPIFDGKTLTGWVQRGGKANYRVEEGAIVGTSRPLTSNSFLCTEKAFGDFILELEFKVDGELNSGIQFRSNAFDEPTTVVRKGSKPTVIPPKRVHGYQCEIDNEPSRDRWWTAGIYDESRRGWLFPGPLGGDGKAFTEQGRRLSNADQWHRIRIEARGENMKTFLDGEPRADIHDAMTPRGFIALQVHGVGAKTEPLEVRWRNIRLANLDPN